MDIKDSIIKHAKMTFLAQLNPYNSVKKVYQNALNAFIDNETDVKYIGIKDVSQIPVHLYKDIKEKGNYVLHTLDVSSFGGRAVDINLKNPVTGNLMSGSSSGTAVNVFLGINDLGIGTDGGGSVLAPAMSLNLFGFICPLIEQEHMKQFNRKSTDNISFSPSLGFITREWNVMKELTGLLLNVENIKRKQSDLIVLSDRKEERDLKISTQKIDFPDTLGERKDVIPFLLENLKKCDFLIAYEGPVDVKGFGDSIFGHFDIRTKEIQKQAGKGLIRIANMVNATAICIPADDLGCGWVFICESNINKIKSMLEQAEQFITGKDALTTKYFLNYDMYFEGGYGSLE